MSKAETFLAVDLMSQPSRACAIFSRMHNLPVIEKPFRLHKQEQMSKEYKENFNAMSRVPALVEHDGAGSAPFKLPESAAILSYLCAKYSDKVPDHWLPRSCLRSRARVESALHWWHGTVRAGAMRLVFNKVLAPRLGAKPNPVVAKEGEIILSRALQELETVWLAGSKYVAGSQPCIADLLMVCELEQLTVLNKERDGSDIQSLLEPYPRVRAWMADVASTCNPYYEAVHATALRKAAAGLNGAPSPAQLLSRL